MDVLLLVFLLKEGALDMETVQATFTFDAAHRLWNYPGKCNNIHGHTYRVDVEVGVMYRETPFILDFSSLKAIVAPILEIWDHSLLLGRTDPLVILLQDSQLKIIALPSAPTAEYMAQLLLESIYGGLGKRLISREWESAVRYFPFLKVSVWETPTNVATAFLKERTFT